MPATPLTLVGAPGTVAAFAAGVTGDDALLAEPLPTLLVATTVNVYAVPLVRPATMMGLLPADAVAPPGDAVAV